MIIAVLASIGFVVGALLPRVIAVIPDREVAPGESAPRSYRELASAKYLPVYLGASTAVVWGVLAAARGDGGSADLTVFLVAGAFAVAMSYVDLREHRLPDWLTFPAFVASAVLLAVAAGVDGQWDAYARAWLAALAAFGVYFILALIRPSDLGFGDVKLAALLGLLLGWMSWSTLLLGVFLGFVVGAVVGVGLIVARKANRHTSIPFGPAMLVGALLAVLLS